MAVSLQDVAQALELTVEQLREFAKFSRRGRSYRHRNLPKRHGEGTRPLAAPRPDVRAVLDRLDYWLKHEVQLPIHDAAHGFVKGRSIATHAAPHADAAVLITLDLADWFTTVKTKRLETSLREVGWAVDAARVVARIATDERTEALPQGSPTSPLFANLVARHLDLRLTRLATQFGCVYTRFADDLTFSSKQPMGHGTVERFLALVERWIRSEGFTVKRKKTKVTRPWQRMAVAGLVVNPAVTGPRGVSTAAGSVRVTREFIRRIRSAIRHHQAKHDNLELTREQIVSAIGFTKMVNPTQAEKLRAALAEVPS